MNGVCGDHVDGGPGARSGHASAKTTASVVKKSAKASSRSSGGSKDWGLSELVDLSATGRMDTRNDRTRDGNRIIGTSMMISNQ